jgi:glutaredoxin 3
LDEWRNEKAAEEVQHTLYSMTLNRSSPWVFVGGRYLGGADETVAACRNGSIEKMLEDAKVYFLSSRS